MVWGHEKLHVLKWQLIKQLVPVLKKKKKIQTFFFSLSLRKRPKFDIVFLAFVKVCSIGKTLHNHRPLYECESACIPAPHVANVIAYVCINFKNILSMEIHI